jgi:quinol monooxygenase YgiN
MILVTLSIVAPPGRREELIQLFWSVIGPIRAEPGCLACGLYEEVGGGGLFYYVEEWTTPEQLERHMRSARYERLLTAMEASAEPPVLRYLTVSACRGLEYLECVRLGAAADAAGPDQPAGE